MANVGEEKAPWLLRLHALANRSGFAKVVAKSFLLLLALLIFLFYNSFSEASLKTMIVSCLGHRGDSRRVEKKGTQHRRTGKGREKWRREAKSRKEKIREHNESRRKRRE